MKLSPKGIDLIKQFEGFRPRAYLCPAGVPTIGYGSTLYANGKPVKLTDLAITEHIALDLLKATLVKYENAVFRYVQVNINQNQFDALVSFAYNLGNAALLGSTLLRKLNAGQYLQASNEFKKWVFADGKKLDGLVKRREAERALFVEPIK